MLYYSSVLLFLVTILWVAQKKIRIQLIGQVSELVLRLIVLIALVDERAAHHQFRFKGIRSLFLEEGSEIEERFRSVFRFH